MATDIDGGASKDTSPRETPLSAVAATLSPMSDFKRVNVPKTPAFEELSSEETSVYGTPDCPEPHQNGPIRSLVLPPETDEDEDEDEEAGLDVEEEEESSPKRQKLLSELSQTKPSDLELPSPSDEIILLAQNGKPSSAKTGSKKSKKKSKDVWSFTTTRKGKKKTKHAFNHNADASNEDKVFITPVPRFPDKNDDSKDMTICLSKIHKAEKVELSEDRMSASSTKGYRMVRTNRGVSDGAWYFEIKVVHLGNSGHTRLGWSTEKGDLQAPVGYDGNSFGYRDIDGSKVHKALREEYGTEAYKEGDVIGFYINLPDGGSFVPNPPRLVWYKGQRYVCAPDSKEDPPKVVSGSEMVYYKNGVCQGVAFKDLYGGWYYPAASMYTLPNEAPCCVKFNFGPDFERFPNDFGERPTPRPMIEVPYQTTCDVVDNGVSSER